MKQPLYQIYLPRPNIFQDIMGVCHYMLNQTIFIRKIFFIYLMTNTKRKYESMLQISWMLPVGTQDPII